MERGRILPEIQEGKLQHQYCRQTDAQVVEPGADSTLLVVIVTLMIVVVFGEDGKQEYGQVCREYRQRDKYNRMIPSGWKKHHVVSG